jgi:Ca2+/H+ antiporter, TMEM165/GDT1 family
LIVLSASGKASRIFWGAALAFLLQAILSVLAGDLLKFVPKSFVEIGAGLLFLYFAGKFWKEAHMPIQTIDLNNSQSIKSVFAIIFMAELGDVSQLAIAASVPQASSKLLVFVVAVAALWLITALALILGRRAGHFINPKRMQKIASFAFCCIGGYLLYRGCLIEGRL